MITKSEAQLLLNEAMKRHDAGYLADVVRLEQNGIDVVIKVPHDDGRPGVYVPEGIIMDEEGTDAAVATLDLIVRCCKRAHMRSLAVAEWNLRHGLRGDALAPWSVWIHDATRTMFERRGMDLHDALRSRGTLGRIEIASMGEIEIGEDGAAYMYDNGWTGTSVIVRNTTLPSTVIQALAGRSLGETIAHPHLPADIPIRTAHIHEGDLRLFLANRYVPVAAAPSNADMSWTEIGIAPWRRTDYVSRPVDT